ncbi:MAG: CARDB domain-containing protein [Pyrinomonadaceae bacterium]
MKRRITLSIALSLCIGLLALMSSDSAALAQQAKVVKPDLSIKQFLFPPTNDKALRVHVVNTGQELSKACRLVLTVRAINGVAVGRRTHVNVPILAAGADDWLHIDAKSILPNNVSLQSTTFKLSVDATKIVAESNESNNEVWHGLLATAAIGQAIGGFANDGDESDAKPEISSTQQLSTAPSEQKSCVRVSGRWSICGSTNFKNRFVAGVGISFNRLDPNGKIVSTRYYKDCSKLAADSTIPADIRKKAAELCKQSLQLAADESTVK